MKKENKKILVGMSGGVDSTVAAALLQKDGYEVYGVFLDFWKSEKAEEDYKSAQKMAEILNIPLTKVNARKEFKQKIVDKFIADYKKGITPNPCVACNPEMKFRILIEEADKRKINLVATGHYARLRKSTVDSSQFTDKEEFPNKSQASNIKSKNKKDELLPVNCELETVNYSLSVAKDKLKDQSYFLYRLNQEQLKRVIFPLGDYLKSQVKIIAKELNLTVADKKESQDVCFIAQDNFEEFLREHISEFPGKIQDTAGKVLGTHNGLHFYTIGQRKGINLGGEGPYYVHKKDMKNNVLVVSNNIEDGNLSRDEFEIRNSNWIKKDIKFPLKANVRLRYHGKMVYAKIKSCSAGRVPFSEGIYSVRLDEPQKAVTPGQSAVFYDGEEVLGGGIII